MCAYRKDSIDGELSKKWDKKIEELKEKQEKQKWINQASPNSRNYGYHGLAKGHKLTKGMCTICVWDHIDSDEDPKLDPLSIFSISHTS